jgi:hypothetical protein
LLSFCLTPFGLKCLDHQNETENSGKLDPRLANSIAYLGTCFLRGLEVADLDSRLKALEGRNL